MKNRLNGFGRSFTAAVVMLCMLFSIFAPTILAASDLEITSNDETKNGKPDLGPLNYVSVGDSMTNGYGFVGYEQDSSDLNVYNPLAKDPHNGGKGDDYGLKMYGNGAYPLQIESMIEEIGFSVNHTKLATSAMMPEDFLYLLGGRDSEIDDNYSGYRSYIGSSSSDKPAEFEKQLVDFRAHVQKAVKEADFITLGLGNANFGAFLMDKITHALGVLGWSFGEADKKLTLEYALTESGIEEADREAVLAFVEKYMAEIDIEAKLAEYGFPAEKMQNALNIAEYTVANFIVNYKLVVEQILKMNPDVSIVFVGLLNTTYGTKMVDENGEVILELGDMMDSMFGMLNDYVKMIPTIAEADKYYPDAWFFFAEQPEPKFICQTLKELYENNWVLVSDNRMSGATVRSRNIDAYNGDLRPMISNAFAAFGISLPGITLADVEAFEANNSGWTNSAYGYGFTGKGDDCKYLSIALYLGLEQAIVECSDINDLTLAGFKTMTNPNELVGALGGFMNDVTLDPNANYEAWLATTPNTVANAFYKQLVSTDDLRGLCKVYGMFKVGNGMSVHPTPAGHDEITNAVWNCAELAYDSKTCAIRDVYYYLYRNGYITFGEALELFGTYSEKSEIELLKSVYDSVLLNEEIEDSDRIAIITKVYSIFNEYGLLNEYESKLALVEALSVCVYTHVNSDAVAFEIVDHVYNEVVVNGNFDQIEIVKYLYDRVVNNHLTEAQAKLNFIVDVYTILNDNDMLADYSENLKLVEALSACIASAVGPEKAFVIADYIYTKVIVEKDLNKEAILDFVYGQISTLPAEEKVPVICQVYFILQAEGELDNYKPMLAIVEELAACVGPYTTYNQQSKLVDYIYGLVADNALDNIDKMAVVDYVYNVVLIDTEISAAEKLELIAGVYAILADDYFGEYTKAFDAIGNIYVALAAENLITADQGFNIVNFVYARIIDGTLDNQEIYEIATYIYNMLFVEMVVSPVALSDALEDYEAAQLIAQKFAIIDIVFTELEKSEFVEEYNLAPVMDLYESLNEEDEEGNRKVSEKSIVTIFDIAFKTVIEKPLASGEVNTEELAIEVAEKLVTSEEIPLAEKATIVNKVVEAVKDSNLGITAEIPEIPDLTHITNILDRLDDKYITMEEANKLLAEVVELVMDGVTDEETIFNFVLSTYDTILGDLDSNYDVAYEQLKDLVWEAVELVKGDKGAINKDNAYAYAMRAYLILRENDEKIAFVVDLYKEIKVEFGLTDKEVNEIIIDNVLEYYDDAYAYIYEYVDGKGYVDTAVDALDVAIDAIWDAIEAVEGAELEADIKADVVAELVNAIDTLEEVKAAIKAGNIENVDKLVDTVLALEDDLWAHLGTLKALGIDSLEYAYEIFMTEVHPEIIRFAELVAAKVEAELPVILGELYDLIVELVAEYAPQLADAIYNYLLNNPEEVIDFFKNYGHYIVDFFEVHGDEVLEVLFYIIDNYGMDILKFIIDNHVEIIGALVYLVSEYGDEAWALIEVYAEATGLTGMIIDQLKAVAGLVEDQIEALKAQLAALEDLLISLRGQLAELEAKLAELYAQLQGAAEELREQILAQIEAIKAQIEAIKAQIAQVIELIKQIKAQIEALIAELQAILAEIDAIMAALAELVNAIIVLVDAIKSGSIAAILAAIDLLKAAFANLLNIIGAAEVLLKHLAYLAQALAALAAFIAENLAQIKAAIAGMIEAINALVAKFGAIFALLEGLLNEYLEALKAAINGLVSELCAAIAELQAKLEYVAGVVTEKLIAAAEKLLPLIEEAAGILVTVKENYETFVAMIEFLYESATSGSYDADEDDSHYVALGDGSAAEGSYADLLAEYLGVRYDNLAERSLIAKDVLDIILENEDLLADADLITLGFSNATMLDFVLNGALGFADVDWAEYFGDDVAAIVDEILALVADELEKLIAEEFGATLGDGENGDLVDMAIAAVEAYIYAYVSHIITLPEIIETLGVLAPNALVVVVGGYNDLEGATIEIEGVTLNIGDYINYVVEFVNLETLLLAMNGYNVVYVDAPAVETILEAEAAANGTAPSILAYLEAIVSGKLLPSEAGHEYILAQILAAVEINKIAAHVHEYDAVCDDTCNICGEKRVAMPHAYYNVCDADCNVCGYIREVEGHKYSADCDTTCNNCGELREAAPHTFGEWVVTRESTKNVMGEKERTCSKCGAVEWELLPLVLDDYIPDLNDGVSAGVIVAITIPSVLALGAGGFAAFWFGYKKRSFKELTDVISKFFATLAK